MYVLLYIVFIKRFGLRKTVVLPCDLYSKTSGIVTLFQALVTKFPERDSIKKVERLSSQNFDKILSRALARV